MNHRRTRGGCHYGDARNLRAACSNAQAAHFDWYWLGQRGVSPFRRPA